MPDIELLDLSPDGPNELILVHTQEGPFQAIQRLGFNEARREIYIDGEIDPDFGDWFLQIHRYLTGKSTDPIDVYLNTGGGDVQSMFMFYDTVRGGGAGLHLQPGYGRHV